MPNSVWALSRPLIG
uniref:Uncharacterized protein n=1 Tax=Anguilla anguilla TaxID=7936 RepID=A0A0E9XGC2_ANGAN